MVETHNLDEAVDFAISNARGSLARESNNAGWQDFRTRTSGVGGDWISAFVLAHAFGDFPQQYLRFERYALSKNCVIGYNAQVPPDLDSSTWAIFALLRQGCNVPLALSESWVQFLQRHWCVSNRIGFSTYEPTSPIVAYKRQNGGWTNFDGWTDTGCHEITALVFHALCGLRRISDFVSHVSQWIDSILADGRLESYWWSSRWYLLSIMLSSIRKLQSDCPSLSGKCGELVQLLKVTGIEESENSPARSAFDIANSIRFFGDISSMDSDAADAARVQSILGVNSLLRSQLPNGSWVSEAIMRIPRPCDTTPWLSKYFSSKIEGTGGLLGDAGVLSTVSALFALNHFMKREAEV